MASIRLAATILVMAGTLPGCGAAGSVSGAAERAASGTAGHSQVDDQAVGRSTLLTTREGDRSADRSCQKIVFHCQTENQKEVRVCDRGQTLEYAFGLPAEPELLLSVRREEARTFQWKGFGRWISYTLNIPNGDVTYTVFSGVDRLTDEHEREAGVSVTKGGEEIARIKCREPVLMLLEGIDVPQE